MQSLYSFKITLALLTCLFAGCQESVDHGAWRAQLFQPVEDAAPRREIAIPTPARLLGIAAPGESGQTVRVRCASCHSMLDVQLTGAAATNGVSADSPHVGLSFQHGNLDCRSCHVEDDPSQLHDATGDRFTAEEALRVCVQCHGLQWRDFQHGAHGGKRGLWDESLGVPERNHCVSCHDPHAPQFGTYRPLPPPLDRHRPSSNSQEANHP